MSSGTVMTVIEASPNPTLRLRWNVPFSGFERWPFLTTGRKHCSIDRGDRMKMWQGKLHRHFENPHCRFIPMCAAFIAAMPSRDSITFIADLIASPLLW